jgi:hypothetical protein
VLTDVRTLLVIDYGHDIVKVLVNVCLYIEKHRLSSISMESLMFSLLSGGGDRSTYHIA